MQHHAILLDPSSASIDLSGQLHGIDWVVLAGNACDVPLAASIEDSCREAGVAFLFHRIDESPQPLEIHAGPNNDHPLPSHPFGTKIDLFQPTLPALKPAAVTEAKTFATPVLREHEPSPSPAFLMRLTEPTGIYLLEDSIPSTASTSDAPNFEVVSHESEKTEPDPTVPFPHISDVEHEEFSRLDALVRQGLDTFIMVGQALSEIRERELWRAGGHPTWAAYCQAVGGLTKIHGNRLIRGSKLGSHLAQVKPVGFTGSTVTPRSEWQIRPLYRLSDTEQQVTAWYRAVELADSQPTEAIVRAAVKVILGEAAPAPNSKPDRKQLLVEAFGRLRDAVRAKRPADEAELRLSELESLLQ